MTKEGRGHERIDAVCVITHSSLIFFRVNVLIHFSVILFEFSTIIVVNPFSAVHIVLIKI